MTRKYFIGLSIILVCLLMSCQPPVTLDKNDIDELGDIQFPTTGSDEAKQHFKTGVLLLHSFEYEDARAAFLRAQTSDPTHAMSYWGEAMTYNHTLWKRQMKEEALNAMEKLGTTKEARMAKLQTDFERDLFEGIEILFGEGTKYDRDVAYADYMKGLTDKYPSSHEVSAFYAISLIGASRNGRNEELYGKTAQIAQGIMEENPNHPGALHYLIHSYDDPDHAHLAKSAADSYAKVAPDAAHALHMPSHIYVALGAWDDVVKSNIASWNASVKRMDKKDLDNSARSYHAFHWLQYGLLQRGEYEAAEAILNNMIQYASEKSDRTARGYLVAMKGAHMVECGITEGEYADIDVNISDLHLTKYVAYNFLNGIKAMHQGDEATLDSIIKVMAKERTMWSITVGDEGFAMCNAGGFNSGIPDRTQIGMVHVMELELEAYLAQMRGDKATVHRKWKEGIALDQKLHYSFGPPTILKPVHEGYAEWLLSEELYEEALVVFDQALERNPRRLRSLKGKMEAAQKLSDQSIIASVTDELAKSTGKKQWDDIL